MTAAQDSAARDVLVKIARGRAINAQGHQQRLSREDLINMARSTCVALGWSWSQPQRPAPVRKDAA